MGDCRWRIGKVIKLIGTCSSHKDLDDSTYFHCSCRIGNIVLSPLIVASLTSNIVQKKKKAHCELRFFALKFFILSYSQSYNKMLWNVICFLMWHTFSNCCDKLHFQLKFFKRYELMYDWTLTVIREWLSKESFESFMLLQIQTQWLPMARLMWSLIFSGKNLDIFKMKHESMVCAQEDFSSQMLWIFFYNYGMKFILCLKPVFLALLLAMSHPKDLE